MLPEVRVIVERAAAHRVSLEGLIEAIPGDYWVRRSSANAWSARDHLAHVATIDALTSELLSTILDGVSTAWVAGAQTPTALASHRESLIEEARCAPIAALRDQMRTTRAALNQHLANIEIQHLDAHVLVAGLVDAWGEPVPFPLRRYLAALPGHDTEHEHAIRHAITAPPDLSAVMLTRRPRPAPTTSIA